MSKNKYVVMIGPSSRSQGGVASVVASWENSGLFERWPIAYLKTHVEGSKFDKLGVAVSALLRFLLLLVSNRVACVHIHVARRLSFWRKSVFAFVAFACRRPVLLHLHSGGFPAFYHHESNLLQQRLIRFVLDRADHLIVLSKVWHDLLRPISINCNIAVIGNFPELPPNSQWKESCHKNVILFMGLLNRDKGFYDLLESVRPLCQEFPDLMVVCGGKGKQEEIVERISQLQLEKHIILPGWLSNSAKAAWLSQAAFFVLPSYVEGNPMGILEAMAWGLPIVSTKVGGIPDMIEHGQEGLLVEPGDIGALQQAIRHLLHNDMERERMGYAARTRIYREFSPQVIMPCIDKLYAEYVKGQPQTRKAKFPRSGEQKARWI